ncbi:hypothetical protein A3I90_00705 [Candidatus Nomurabacteria bacterium RIFCSPLOWO2_02_FULL_41_9]|nr:MAG: hypothetical protein A3I90_00705 [Candidatus Nomurabacteria bacterium RIFCSPLOWO2_02_FULL_41_9]
MKTALISVYDKTGIEGFAGDLVALDFKIFASGGTAKALLDAGIPVEDTASLAGGGSILGHRVVTLSREIHAGLLAKDNKEDREELSKLKIPFIDLVCADFYPLEEEIKKAEATRESVIEKTDIGGPTMVRSGAKGRRIVVCDSGDRTKVIKWLKAGEPDREKFINDLAAKAEAVVGRYIVQSAEYHSEGRYKQIFGEKFLECAYGENAYQKPACLYSSDVGRPNFGRPTSDELAIYKWVLVAGNPMSYNNICDLDRMMQTMTHIGAGFEKNFGFIPFVAIGVKHGNACGAAAGDNPVEVIEKMLTGDLRAIFGGSVMLNFPVDEKIADELIHKYSGEVRRLLDIVAAPSFTPEAVEILSRKKGKCRLLMNPAILKAGLSSFDTAKRFRYVRGGFLTQPNYTFLPDMSKCLFDTKIIGDIMLAWAVGCTSNSNTITLVKNGRLAGNGVGQQDRVGAAKLAIFRADEAVLEMQKVVGVPLGTPTTKSTKLADLEGAVAYSDSFFPFPDAPELLIERGIKTIFSTSGSVNDEKIIELCKNKGVNLVLLPDAEARGFYQH